MAALQDEQVEGNIVGLNLTTGEPMDPIQEGIYDSFRVLRNCIASSAGIASNLLLCDELLKARQMVNKFSLSFASYTNVYRGGNKAQGLVKERAELPIVHFHTWRHIKENSDKYDTMSLLKTIVHQFHMKIKDPLESVDSCYFLFRFWSPMTTLEMMNYACKSRHLRLPLEIELNNPNPNWLSIIYVIFLINDIAPRCTN